MQITATNPHNPALIQRAVSHCGRFECSTFWDGLVIDGRSAWRGEWVEDDGRVAGRRVDPELWAQACELTAEVDAHNHAVRAAERDRQDAAHAARIEHLEQITAGVRGWDDATH